jgi:uncharacterized protein YgbK (DUF1537 family)
MSILLGAIGDDITGSTDLALMLAQNGMSTVQYLGIPPRRVAAQECQAAVVALKSRTAPVEQAVQESLQACDWLLEQGAVQIIFKYCSTFDSTENGNIGPVAEALLNHLGDDITVVCPAFPANARTIYKGHLYVGDTLLAESGMRDHPLTPMRDSNLVRFMGRQVSDPDTMGLIPYEVVDKGEEAVTRALYELLHAGKRFVVLDSLQDEHLRSCGKAIAGLKLVTGGSGIAMGLPQNLREQRLLTEPGGFADMPRLKGKAAVLAGSCSIATRGQVKHMAAEHPALAIDPLTLDQGGQGPDRAADWAGERLAKGPVLIYSSNEPEEVAKAQAELGKQQAGEVVEDFFAGLARRLVEEMGVDKLIVAGGETSGAVMKALDISALHIGPEIDPGVPWTVSVGKKPICLALKSGNFGTEDFFLKALEMLA